MNTKKHIILHKPKLSELWFSEKCMSDPKTMNYNAGYNLPFEEYHNDTGCIDFPQEKWEDWFNNKMSNPNFFYAYILDTQTNTFVGYCNFNKNSNKKASMGIVIKNEFRGMGYMRPAMQEFIKEAKKMGVEYLTDSVPQNRKNALKVFLDLGFIITKTFTIKKFNKDEIVEEIELKL